MYKDMGLAAVQRSRDMTAVRQSQEGSDPPLDVQLKPKTHLKNIAI